MRLFAAFTPNHKYIILFGDLHVQGFCNDAEYIFQREIVEGGCKFATVRFITGKLNLHAIGPFDLLCDCGEIIMLKNQLPCLPCQEVGIGNG